MLQQKWMTSLCDVQDGHQIANMSIIIVKGEIGHQYGALWRERCLNLVPIFYQFLEMENLFDFWVGIFQDDLWYS